MDDHLDVLRRFNRAYTQRIGVLDESFLGTGRPLGPSRLLFEVGAAGRGGARVGDLRRRAGLDSGYLSRLLRQLEAEDLVRVVADPDDGRQRVVRLTAAGRRAWTSLDRRPDGLAARLLAPLSERQRDELRAALASAERLLRAATVVFEPVDPGSRDARVATASYFAELDRRFPTGFDAGTASAQDRRALRPPDGTFVVVRDDVALVGCGGVQRIDEHTGEIKRMWIHPDWRGLGLGRRLLAHLEGTAQELGRTRVLLDTNGTLTEAIGMYRSAGYQPIERYNDNPYAQHWFAKDLRG